MPLLIILAIIAFIAWVVISFLWWAITGTADLLGGWFNLLLVAAVIFVIVQLVRGRKERY
jgi:hypothetical protein